MAKIQALILTGYGLNCDHETAHAFNLAGAMGTRVHINELINGSVSLDDFQIMAFVGGFSWGDDHGAGVIQAVRMKTRMGEKILEFVEKGNLVIGICNGFQTLVNMGLLPGFKTEKDSDKSWKRCVALTYNDCGNFRDDWVTLKTDSMSKCVFTKGMDTMELPIRHGEGKFYADNSVIEHLLKNNQVAIRYAMPDGAPAKGNFPHNPNGSVDDIAGICDSTGRIFGLMPHPEAFNHWTNHPDWTRIKERLKREGKTPDKGITAGIRIFKNGVDYLGLAQK